MSERVSIRFQITQEDTQYILRMRNLVAGRADIMANNAEVSTLTEVVMAANRQGIKRIATTSVSLLEKLLGNPKRKVSIADYQGSIIPFQDREFLILPPFEHLVTVPHGEHVMRRYLNKFINESDWLAQPDFTWALFHPSMTDDLIELADKCTFIAVDIETGHEDDRVILMCGFSFVTIHPHTKSYSISTVVIPYEDEYNYVVTTAILQSNTPKVFQNGMYDNSYFLRYRQPVINWAFDTINAFHAWYAELPKTLAFITSYMIRSTQYWKHEGGSGDMQTEAAYCAKDCYNTALGWLALMREMPAWAWNNYFMEFPVVFPNLFAGIHGLRRNNAEMEVIRKDWLKGLETQRADLQKMVGSPFYNPGSPAQNLRLLQALGCGDLKGAGKIPRDKARARHPLNRRIMDALDKYASHAKIESSYLRDEQEKNDKPVLDKYGKPKTKTWNGRLLYNIIPHGTDTGRNSSQESPFWCGWQIQNWPRDMEELAIKDGIEAEPGFYFSENDKSQAEARYTAYASGDTKLITNVEEPSRDFHGFNASQFFGLKYEEIVRSTFNEEFQEWDHKTINKPVRDLSKRTNHGANYNMQAQVLLDTMGIDKVILAKRLLKLPKDWSLLKVCQYLLDNFDKTYPVVRGDYYNYIKKCIRTTKMLVGATGWTRYCFGKPWENKRDMNRYAAHIGQSLNAMVLNGAVLRVFFNIALVYPNDYIYCAQVHDSILSQYRIGEDWLPFAVAFEMVNPIKVKDSFGITRTMQVPVDTKGGSTRWGKVKDMKLRDLSSENRKKLEDHIRRSTYRPWRI